MYKNSTKLMFFGGKGGVGKTTCSAAVAVKLASEGVKTLHITTDMAPSLSDIYGADLKDNLRHVTRNLDVMEISQDYIAGVWKEKFGPDFVGILSHFLDMEGMLKDGELDLLDYIGTAPSLREETLLDMIMEMAVAGQYGRIVWDTAPAGETLKLLYMPRLMRQHLKSGAKVYEAMDRIAGVMSHKRTLAGIMEEWVERSENIASFLKANTLFFIVANPEALVVNQAERVMASLRQADFEVRGLIINRIAVRDGYGFLAGMHARQQPYIQQLKNLADGLPVAEVPLTLEEIYGIRPLRELGTILFDGLGLSNRGAVEGPHHVSV